MAWGRLALIEAAKVSPDTLTRVATVFDYQKEKLLDEDKKEVIPSGGGASEDRTEALKGDDEIKRPLASFVRVIKIEPLEKTKEQSHDYLSDPQQQLTADSATGGGTYQFAQPRQLLTSAQLIPFLHSSLGMQQAGKKIDHRVLNRLLSKGQAIKKLPLKPVQRWSQQLQVIVDTGEHLRPYRKDFEDLVGLLKQLLGKNNVSSLRFDINNQRHTQLKCIEWPTPKNVQWTIWERPPTDIPVLILGDFGVTDENDDSDVFWLRFSRSLHSHLAPVVTLSPVASSPNCSTTCRPLTVSPLRDTISLPRHASHQGFNQPQFNADKMRDILIFLSPLPIIDTGLLRLLRDEFNWGASYLEAQIWNHPDMQRGSLGVRVKPSLAKEYTKRFRQEVSLEDIEKLWRLVENHHKNAYQGLRQLEFIGESVSKDSNNESVRTYLKQLCATTSQSEKGSARHDALVMQCKTYLASQPDDIWVGELADVFYDVCGMAYESEIKQGQLPPALGDKFRLDRLKWLLDKSEQNERVTWVVYQTGGGGDICFEQLGKETNITSPLYTFDALKKIPPTLHRDDGTTLLLSEKLVVTLNEKESVSIHGEKEYVYFDVLSKPEWAIAISRDKYGLYTDLALTPNHTQRFRWIPAGTFQMGSPKSEPERESWSKETQHQVTLSQGYWLADTTVTQAQWQAVTGKTPSNFKGENLPVEKVSWDDSQDFINKLKNQHPHIAFRLPSEAQWEYACRAGTTTPFSFGVNITPEQVNYEGNYPYDDGQKGEYRKITVPVKSLPCNQWGLYEMHGNVFEWCSDSWQDDLGSQPVIDPESNEAGALRVIRGGSWYDDGRDARSADRFHDLPDDRRDSLGLRLSFGHPSASSGGGAAKTG